MDYQYDFLENGLATAVLPAKSQNECVISLTIGFDSLSVLSDYPGLAHLTEHLLFRGSKAYPQENVLINLCESNSGSVNAITTNSHCQLNCVFPLDILENAMDILVDMVTFPQFKLAAITAEMDIIDDEFNTKANDDIAKLRQIQQHTANPSHPYHSFTTGNKQGFKTRTVENWQGTIQEFHRQQFVAGNMSICIALPEVMKNHVPSILTVFERIPMGVAPKKTIVTPRFDELHKGYFSFQCATDTSEQLIINFPLDLDPKDNKKTQLAVIEMLIKSPHEGGLLSALRNANLAFNVHAGTEQCTQTDADFYIHILLTPQGSAQLDSVHNLCLCYLDTVRTVATESWRIEEVQKMQRITRSKIQSNQLDIASEISLDLLTIRTTQASSENDEAGNQFTANDYLLKALSFNNMRSFHITNSPEQSRLYCDRESEKRFEPWYMTPYFYRPLPPLLTLPANQQWVLPAKNRYLENYRESSSPCGIDLNESRVASDSFESYVVCRHDNNINNGEIYLAFRGDGLISDVYKKTLGELLVTALNARIQKSLGSAVAAGLSVKFYAASHGLSLQAKGHVDGLMILVNTCIVELLSSSITRQEYDSALYALTTKYQRQCNQQEVYQLFSGLSHHMLPSSYHSLDKLKAVKVLTHSSAVSFQQSLLSLSNITTMFAGHWLPQQMHQIEQLIITNTQRERASATISETGLKAHTEHHERLYLNTSKTHQQNAQLTYFFSPSPLLEEKALFMLTEHIVSPVFFQQVRGEEQAGYLIGSHYLPHGEHPGIVFYGQTTPEKSNELEAKVDYFIQQLPDLINGMTSEHFHIARSQVRSQLNKPAPHPSHWYKSQWLQLFAKTKQSVVSDEIEHIFETIEPSDFIDFINRLVKQTSLCRIDVFSNKSH